MCENNKNSIPKIIHYCWFGKNEKPDIVKKCIDSWKRNLKEYKIIEWNEENFNIEENLFVKQAYEAKKFAFVSDYVRVNALYNYGGIYLDTDVEVIKEFSDDMLSQESFWGFEEKNYIATSTIGSKKGNILIKKFLDQYNDMTFIDNEGNFDLSTNVCLISNMMKELGFELNGEFQKIHSIATIYPQEYFSPYDYINCYLKSSKNTYTVHHFYKSWLPLDARIKGKIKKILANIIGGEKIAYIRKKLVRE